MPADNFKPFERKPENLKDLQGTSRKDRKLEDEIKPEKPKSIPKPPPWMSATGKRFFKKLAPIIYEKNLLTDFDIHSFETACHEFGKYIELEKFLKEEGYTYEQVGTTSTGETFIKGWAQRPEVSISRNCCQIAINIFKTFGLNPLDRGKLRIETKEEKKDGFEVFLGKKNRPA